MAITKKPEFINQLPIEKPTVNKQIGQQLTFTNTENTEDMPVEFRILPYETREAIDYMIKSMAIDISSSSDPKLAKERAEIAENYEKWRNEARQYYASDTELHPSLIEFRKASIAYQILPKLFRDAIEHEVERGYNELLADTDPKKAELVALAKASPEAIKMNIRLQLAQLPFDELSDLVRMQNADELSEAINKTPIFDALSEPQKKAVTYFVDKEYEALLKKDPQNMTEREKLDADFARKDPEFYKKRARERMAGKTAEELNDMVKKYDLEMIQNKAKGELLQHGLRMDEHHDILPAMVNYADNRKDRSTSPMT